MFTLASRASICFVSPGFHTDFGERGGGGDLDRRSMTTAVWLIVAGMPWIGLDWVGLKMPTEARYLGCGITMTSHALIWSLRKLATERVNIND